MKTTQERLKESDILWFKYVIPTVQNRFPGEWRTEIGTDRDLKNGIDYTRIQRERRRLLSLLGYGSLDRVSTSLYAGREPSIRRWV